MGIDALARTWRLERLDVHHRETAFAAPACVLVLWHGRLLLPMYAHTGAGFTVLVSPSADGAISARLLERSGQTVVRGSKNKTPAKALRALARELEAGRRVVLTPDGPRGPRHSMNLGAVWLASRCGVPVLPMGVACDRFWQFSSWDRFTIAKPRARVAIVYGEPLTVPAEASDEVLAAASDTLRDALLAAEERGFRHLGVPSDA